MNTFIIHTYVPAVLRQVLRVVRAAVPVPAGAVSGRRPPGGAAPL